jgi:hypothetical protein
VDAFGHVHILKETTDLTGSIRKVLIVRQVHLLFFDGTHETLSIAVLFGFADRRHADLSVMFFQQVNIGFHRDELAMLDYARHLDWGFVDFPPLAPFIIRSGYELFGGSLPGVRLFGALAQSLAMLLAGLMARELGGSRWAQVTAAIAAGIAPWSMLLGSVLVYTTLDYLWWVLIAYLMIRLLKTENPRYSEFKEEIGWPDLVEAVARIYIALPPEEQAVTGILTGNYGEAGAINLYGPAYGLPQAISGVNSYWLRGYGDPALQTVIVLGEDAGRAYRFFTICNSAGRITNRYGVKNEETRHHPTILVCRELRKPWTEMWKTILHFG